MKPGSVIVDLAGEAGGNCELAKPGETYVTDGGVTIAAPLNLPSSMAEHASQLYARNVLSLLELMTGEEGALTLDFDDEVIAGACITRGGEIVHERRAVEEGGLMDLLTELAILVLAAFVGFEVISKVPNTLHTPLMSGTNAIHGIVVLGGLLLIGPADGLPRGRAAGDRDRLRHDQRRRRLPRHRPDARDVQEQAGARSTRRRTEETSAAVSRNDVNLLYIVAFVALHRRPAHAARAAHRGARQPGRGRRHGDRGRARRCSSRASATGG